MGLSDNQAVFHIGRYRIFEEIVGEDSRMYIRGLSEKIINKAIAEVRRNNSTQKVEVIIEHNGKVFNFIQNKAGAKRLLCREIKN